MTTARDLIQDAFENIGILAEGEAMSADAAQKGLRTLNQMISSWNTQNQTVLGIQIEELSLVIGQTSYTMGSGGDLDTTIPIYTDCAFIKLSDNIEYPIEVIDNKKYGDLILKTEQSSIPRQIYIDKGYPLKTIKIYPKPSQTSTLILHNYKQITSFSGLASLANLPQGYEEAITYNLSIRLAPKYGKSISPEVSTIASQSLSNIKRVNSSMREAQLDPALASSRYGFNWRTGE
jgi:hypothetical protein